MDGLIPKHDSIKGKQPYAERLLRSNRRRSRVASLKRNWTHTRSQVEIKAAGGHAPERCLAETTYTSPINGIVINIPEACGRYVVPGIQNSHAAS